jgi:cytochrome c-type biogenesis protein CcsB
MAEVLLYLSLAAYFGGTALWLGFFVAQRESLCRAGAWAMGLGLIPHTLALVWRAWNYGHFPGATLGDTFLVLDWALVAAFLILNWRFPIKVLGALAAPLAALLICGVLILPPGKGPVSPLLNSVWLAVHIILALWGYAALTLAFLGGIFYLVQERQLKGKKFGSFFFRRLPSLEQLDALNYWCLAIGFPLFTLGIIAGSLYAQHTLGRLWSWDPKEVLTLIAWLIYAVLLHERFTVGWRGRRAALLAIFGFLFLALTFVGANLWFSSYHSFESFTRQP